MGWFDDFGDLEGLDPYGGRFNDGGAGGGWDFSGPEWGGWGANIGDFGQIEMPSWAGWTDADLMYAGDLGGYTFNTTTHDVKGPGGETALRGDTELEQRAMGGGNLVAPDLPLAEGQPTIFETAPESPMPAGGGIRTGYEPLPTLPSVPGVPGAIRTGYERLAEGSGGPGAPQPPNAPGVLDAANRFLGTNAGRLAGAAGVGLLGLGAQQLFAGGTPRYQAPTFQPSRAATAGQEAVLRALEGPTGPALTETLATGVAGQRDIAQMVGERIARERAAEGEAAPYERAVRMAALGDVQGLMRPGAETPIADPVAAAIREELLGVLGGGASGVSPATARRQSLEEQETRARLYRQLGPDYELTTPGIQTLNEMKQRHTSEQYTERQATIARLSPLEESRMRFATATPTALLGQREGLRRSNLADVERLSQFGVRGTPQNVTTLSSIVPVSTLLGGDPDRANLINAQIQGDAARAAFSGETARRANLSRGIGDVAGLVAGTVAARPSRMDEYYGRLLAGAPGGYGG